MNDLATAGALLGGAFGVAKPVAESASRLAEKLLGEPFQVAGSMIADQVYAWQTANRIRLLSRVEALLKERGVAPESVATGFLLEAIESGGRVDQEDLQTLWAALISGAVEHPANAQPIFVHALKQLSSDDIVVVKCFIKAQGGARNQVRLSTFSAPNGIASVGRMIALGLIERGDSNARVVGGIPMIQRVIDHRRPIDTNDLDLFRLSHFGMQLFAAVGFLPEKFETRPWVGDDGSD